MEKFSISCRPSFTHHGDAGLDEVDGRVICATADTCIPRVCWPLSPRYVARPAQHSQGRSYCRRGCTCLAGSLSAQNQSQILPAFCNRSRNDAHAGEEDVRSSSELAVSNSFLPTTNAEHEPHLAYAGSPFAGLTALLVGMQSAAGALAASLGRVTWPFTTIVLLQRKAVDWMGLTLIDRQLEAGKIMYKLGIPTPFIRHSFLRLSCTHSLGKSAPYWKPQPHRDAIQETNQHIRDVATCQRQGYKQSNIPSQYL